MLLSTVISRLREEVSEPSGGANLTWSDAELAGIITDQVHIMVRRQIALDEEYHNHRYVLLSSSATQRASNIWEYLLPEWGAKITEVRIRQTDGVLENPQGRVLRSRDRFGGQGWRYGGRRVLELYGFSSPEDLEVACAKRPARLTKGTLPDQTGMGTTQLRLDADSSANALVYPHETETDAYANGIFQITGVDAAGSHVVSGQMRDAISSAHLQEFSGALYTVLTMRSAWTVQPAAGDTYEMHPEIDDEHLRLLILLAARVAWTRKGNSDEVRASQSELFQEWQEYERHIQPRTLQEPKIVKDHLYPELSYTNRRGDEDGSDFWFGGPS